MTEKKRPDQYREVGIDQPAMLADRAAANVNAPLTTGPRTNPDHRDYETARVLVRVWLSGLHASVSGAIPLDDGGQLLDSIAWALTELRDRCAALVAKDLDGIAGDLEAVVLGLREAANVARARVAGGERT